MPIGNLNNLIAGGIAGILPPAQHSQIYGVLGEFGSFSEITGGDYAMERQAYAEAGGTGTVRLRGRYSISEIVLRRVYRHELDQGVIEWAKLWLTGDIQATPRVAMRVIDRFDASRFGRLSSGLRLVQDIETYSGCKCVALNYPEGRAGENVTAMLTLTLSRDT